VIVWIKAILQRGFTLPVAYDPVSKKPSVTLLFFYISYTLSAVVTVISSYLLLVKGAYFVAAIMPTVQAFMTFVFYRLRSLDHVSIDLDDREIDLSTSKEGNEN
jgi:hypothetical protein